jgi:hypothetical protein
MGLGRKRSIKFEVQGGQESYGTGLRARVSAIKD